MQLHATMRRLIKRQKQIYSDEREKSNVIFVMCEIM